MIYCLTGKIIKKTMNAVVVSCGGVGYYAQCPASVAGALPGVGKETTLYTVMSVTENDVSLYGFATEEQQACFEMLTAVSGVGPKVGLAILSVMEMCIRDSPTVEVATNQELSNRTCDFF